MNYNPEIQKLIEWAKFTVEETRAQVGFPDGSDPEEYSRVPSWLPELEAAIETVEASQDA